jgi:hypothetical protein
MARTIAAATVLTLLTITAGCTMCAHPYDYCGPTHGAGGCHDCGSDCGDCGTCGGGGECNDCGDGGLAYDHCSACPDYGCCDPLARAGSVLSPPLGISASGHTVVAASATTESEGQPTPAASGRTAAPSGLPAEPPPASPYDAGGARERTTRQPRTAPR